MCYRCCYTTVEKLRDWTLSSLDLEENFTNSCFDSFMVKIFCVIDLDQLGGIKDELPTFEFQNVQWNFRCLTCPLSCDLPCKFVEFVTITFGIRLSVHICFGTKTFLQTK